MRVARAEHGAARAGERRVRHRRAHQALAESAAAMFLEHVDVAEIGERGVVGHHAREADLRAARALS